MKHKCENGFYLTKAETEKLSTWSCDMKGYHQKVGYHDYNDNKSPAFTISNSLYIFALEPAPPKVNNINDYIVAAIREKSLTYFYFFLHSYEAILNKRIKKELHNEGIYNASPEDYLDIKMIYHDYLLKKMLTFDTSHGIQFTSYIEKGKRDPILAAFLLREDWSSSSLNEYKTDRKTVCNPGNEDDAFRKAISAYQEKHHCTFEKAYSAIKKPQMKRRRVSLSQYDNIGDDSSDDEISNHIGRHYDTTHDYNSDYSGCIHRDTTDAIIDKILGNMDEDTVEIMMRLNGICPNCADVKMLSDAENLEDIAIDFCCSKQKISDIYHKGIETLKTELIKQGVIEGAYIRKEKSEGDTSTYSYRIYGRSNVVSKGRVAFNTSTKNGEIISLADGDDSHFVNGIIAFLSNLNPSALPEKFLVPIHKNEE